MNENDTGGSFSLRRTLALLSAFDDDHREMTVRELAQRAGVSRSTTHRLTSVLLEWGALQRTPNGLAVGIRLFELGTLAPPNTALRAASIPVLHRLHEMTGLTVNLAVLDGTEIVRLEKINAPLPVIPTRLGDRDPVHATALGKVLLAFSEERESLLAGLVEPFVRWTPSTLTTVHSLTAEVLDIRRRGVAFDNEEHQNGVFCVAAPVKDTRGYALAALSVTGATKRSQAASFQPLVTAAATGISRQLREETRRAAISLGAIR